MIAETNTLTTTANLAGSLERSQLLEQFPWVRHGVSRRVAGLGLADGNVGYTAPRDEADAWAMRQAWMRALDLDPESMIRVRQVHGNAVHIATDADLARGAHPDAGEAPTADAVITNVPGLALTTLHADCLAMLLVDPVQRVIGAVHAGWRSTVLDIAGETIRTMTSTYQTRPEDVVAYIGPSIGERRYQVGPEVVAAWQELAPVSDALLESEDGVYFDLKRANAELLVAAGVKDANIDISPVCTASDPENWFSHRGQGPLTGRFAAIIAIAGEPA